MANNSVKIRVTDTSSSWDSFKMPAGGTATDIRRSAAELRNTASQEAKTLSGAYISPTPNKPKR